MVQLPEPLDPENREQRTAADFCDEIKRPRNIAELTKERLRRAAKEVQRDHPSNTADLLDAADNLVPGRSEDDLLVELLLKQGIDLTEPVVTETVAGVPVHAFGGGVLMVCLADVTAANAEALADGIASWHARLAPVRQTTVFFKDSGFENDVAKTNVAEILRQRLGKELLQVRSV